MNYQRQMRLVLLYTLKQLSGSAEKSDVMRYINDHGYWYVNDESDTRQYSRGENEKQWRNDLSYERIHLIEHGYMKPKVKRGLWEMTRAGEAYLSELIGEAKETALTGQPRITPALLQELFSEPSFEETLEDHRLMVQVSQQTQPADSGESAQLSDKPIPKGPHMVSGGRNVYLRDPSVAKRAPKRAGHLCAIDPAHPSFIRRKEACLYMEPHHLIPMSMTDYFGVGLDREQNIFSLCSTCHNQIHYGTKEDVRRLIQTLFCSRKREICAILGREIRLNELYRIYRVGEDTR